MAFNCIDINYTFFLKPSSNAELGKVRRGEIRVCNHGSKLILNFVLSAQGWEIVFLSDIYFWCLYLHIPCVRVRIFQI